MMSTYLRILRGSRRRGGAFGALAAGSLIGGIGGNGASTLALGSIRRDVAVGRGWVKDEVHFMLAVRGPEVNRHEEE